MDFGKVSPSQLEKIDFSLPPDPESNRQILPGVRVATPGIYIGCPRWGVKEWVGKLYPKGTKDAHFLEEYVRQFNCIELNSTFYNLYDEATIAKWSEKAGSLRFKFCPKVFQGISHQGSLHEKTALMHAFEKSIAAFGSHLGPAFLQLNDGFGPQRKKELQQFVHSLPPSLGLFVEVRHPGWFEAAELDWLTAMLHAADKGLVITDTAGRRDACHLRLTTTKTMARFVANNLHPTDHSRIDQWVQRLTGWVENGLEEGYFFLHMANEKHSPELAVYLVDRLNASLGLNLRKPTLLQQELF